jgi:predicted ATPase
MSAYRLVTLTGPGGIGKTSLALKAARGVMGDYADGSWLVELASLSDPALISSAVAGALKVPTGATNVTPETIARSIGDKKLLLVLDNCEHLIEAVATLAETLVAHCPQATIIATSREILRIAGEQVYRVLPLEVPAAGRDHADHILSHGAVELFIVRTKALDSGFSPRTDELPSIGAICRHLDGIPLAIEFAAAHASTFGLYSVAAVAKSLVTLDRDVASRWYLLETIRAYAMEKLTERGEYPATARRHAEYLRDLIVPVAVNAKVQLDASNGSRCGRELDNVRAALAWAFSPEGDTAIGVTLTAAFAPIWVHLSLVGECRERVEQLRAIQQTGIHLRPRRAANVHCVLNVVDDDTGVARAQSRCGHQSSGTR